MTIQDLMPILRPGWVAMDENGEWWWFDAEPLRIDTGWINPDGVISFGIQTALSVNFKDDITPFDGGWENSLIKVG